MTDAATMYADEGEQATKFKFPGRSKSSQDFQHTAFTSPRLFTPKAIIGYPVVAPSTSPEYTFQKAIPDRIKDIVCYQHLSKIKLKKSVSCISETRYWIVSEVAGIGILHLV
jgi:hypothetical protein